MSNQLSRLSKGNLRLILGGLKHGDAYMTTLAEFLKREEDKFGLTGLAEKTGVAHTSIRKIINGDYKRDIETFIKIANTYQMPLWKIMQMADYNLGLSSDEVATQISSLVRVIPEYGPVFERLASLDPRDLEVMVVHLSALLDSQSRLADRTSEK